MVNHKVSSVYQSTQCAFAAGVIEAAPLSAKRRPVSIFRNKEFIHRVDVLSGDDSWDSLLEQAMHRAGQPRYCKVKATLGQLLEKAFLLEHVKTGNVSMLSEGKAVSGSTFSLCRGKLKLYLDKETYERSGLSGKPDERSGNREMQPKWYVSYDLQCPSMQHGRRGFDRLVYACKSISDQPLNWVCTVDNSSKNSTSPDPLRHIKVESKHEISPCVTTHQIAMPAIRSILDDGEIEHQEELATQLYEWLSLLRLESPRVQYNDNIDSYLSRYGGPGRLEGPMKVRHICWEGFLSSSWASSLVSSLLDGCPPGSWVAISAASMAESGISGRSEITVMKAPECNSRYMMWEIKHNS